MYLKINIIYRINNIEILKIYNLDLDLYCHKMLHIISANNKYESLTFFFFKKETFCNDTG